MLFINTYIIIKYLKLNIQTLNSTAAIISQIKSYTKWSNQEWNQVFLPFNKNSYDICTIITENRYI